jgi:hypothetical protein
MAPRGNSAENSPNLGGRESHDPNSNRTIPEAFATILTKPWCTGGN